MSEKLTPAMARALAAVDAGSVEHIYRSNGNVFRGPKSVGASVLRRAEKLRLIMDGRLYGKWGSACPVQLTPMGRAWLNEGRQP